MRLAYVVACMHPRQAIVLLCASVYSSIQSTAPLFQAQGCPEATVKAAVYSQLCAKADVFGLKNVLDWDFPDGPVAKT